MAYRSVNLRQGQLLDHQPCTLSRARLKKLTPEPVVRSNEQDQRGPFREMVSRNVTTKVCLHPSADVFGPYHHFVLELRRHRHRALFATELNSDEAGQAMLKLVARRTAVCEGFEQFSSRHGPFRLPNGWRVSGERRAGGDERVRCTRVLGGGILRNRPTAERRQSGLAWYRAGLSCRAQHRGNDHRMPS